MSIRHKYNHNLFVSKCHKDYFYIMDLKEFLEQGANHYLPNLSIDMVIIGYKHKELKCLLLLAGGKWMVPGGYVRTDESVEEAVYGVLKVRTALEHPHMKFLSVFGDKNRYFKDEIKKSFQSFGLPWREDYWLNNRFVTLAYYSLVNIEETQPSVGHFDEDFAWFSIDDLPEMWMDHKDIVLTARQRIKEDIKLDLVSPELLPDQFTMPALHQLHETILEEKIDRSRFQKNMLSTGLFERLPKLKKESRGRNPYQYRLKKVIPNHERRP